MHLLRLLNLFFVSEQGNILRLWTPKTKISINCSNIQKETATQFADKITHNCIWNMESGASGTTVISPHHHSSQFFPLSSIAIAIPPVYSIAPGQQRLLQVWYGLINWLVTAEDYCANYNRYAPVTLHRRQVERTRWDTYPLRDDKPRHTKWVRVPAALCSLQDHK